MPCHLCKGLTATGHGSDVPAYERRYQFAVALSEAGWQALAQQLLADSKICETCAYYVRQALNEVGNARNVLRRAYAIEASPRIGELMAAVDLGVGDGSLSESQSLMQLRGGVPEAPIEPNESRRALDRQHIDRLSSLGLLTSQQLSEGELAAALTRFAELAKTPDVAVARNSGHCVGLWFGGVELTGGRTPITPHALYGYLRHLADRESVTVDAAAYERVLTGSYEARDFECNQQKGRLFYWQTLTEHTDLRCLVDVGLPHIEPLSSCPCGSGKRYRNCHGKQLELLQRHFHAASTDLKQRTVAMQINEAVVEMWRLARLPKRPEPSPRPAAKELADIEKELARITSKDLKTKLANTMAGVDAQVRAGNHPPQPVMFDIWRAFRPGDAWQHTMKLRDEERSVLPNEVTKARLDRAMRLYSTWSTELHPNRRPGVPESIPQQALPERVMERSKLQRAMEQLRRHKDAPGIVGMSVDEFSGYPKEHRVEMHEDLGAGRDPPMEDAREIDAVAFADRFGCAPEQLLRLLTMHDDWSLAGELARAQLGSGGVAVADPAYSIESYARALVYHGSPHLSGTEQEQLNPRIHTSYLSGGPTWGPNYDERYARSLHEAAQIVRFWILLTCVIGEQRSLQHVITCSGSPLVKHVAGFVLEETHRSVSS